MTPLDGLIILAFVAWSVATGLACGPRASRRLDEYFLAGRSLGGWSAGASMAATQFAADTPLLVTSLIANGGIFALWQLWIYAAAFLLMGFVLAPGWRRAGVLTDAEPSELRDGGRPAALLRGVKAVWFSAVFNCIVRGMVLRAARIITAPFLLWDAWLPIGLGLLLFLPATDAVLAELAAGREATFVRGMAELLPSALHGPMLDRMPAALASIVDTHRNRGAFYWTNDLYRRFLYRGWLRREPEDRSRVRLGPPRQRRDPRPSCCW